MMMVVGVWSLLLLFLFVGGVHSSIDDDGRRSSAAVLEEEIATPTSLRRQESLEKAIRKPYQIDDESQSVGKRRTTRTAGCSGVRKIVRRKDNVTDEAFRHILSKRTGVDILRDIQKTPFFAICIDARDEDLESLDQVASIEDDPPRFLAEDQGDDSRQLQTEEQLVSYGVDMVSAREFWGQYGTQGEGVTICVIDTGVVAEHEDLLETNFTGNDVSNETGL